MNNYLDENADEIVRRFEQYLSGETPGYFDVEELETISEYYLHKGRTKDSNRAIDVGLRLHPASSELQIKRAKTYLAIGEINKALATLDRLPNPNDYEAMLLKIEALSKLNRTEEAEILADHILDSNDDDIDNICMDIAFVFQGQEEFSTAEKFLLEGDKANPRNIDLLFELAYCRERLNKTAEAIEAYNRILDIDPYTCEAWFNLGQVYFEQEDYQKAADAYAYCLTIDSDDPLTWLQKGHVHFMSKQYKEAIDCYMHCRGQREAEPWSVECFIGECYEKMSDFNTALHFYEDATRQKPDNYEGYIGQSICLMELERDKEALEPIRKAISLQPDSYDAYVYLAEAYSNMDMMDESAQAYQKSLELEPRQAETLMAYGNLLMDMERYEDALKAYQGALELDENLEYLHLMLATAYARTEDYHQTFICLDTAVKKNPKALDLFLELCPEFNELISYMVARAMKEEKAKENPKNKNKKDENNDSDHDND